MKNMKPVWRMNTGNGVPSDFGGFVSYAGRNISLEKHGKDRLRRSWYWDIIGDDCDIYAYQTNRTREAKR